MSWTHTLAYAFGVFMSNIFISFQKALETNIFLMLLTLIVMVWEEGLWRDNEL